MPLINGQKMAWYGAPATTPSLPSLLSSADAPSEPCIRGHRSTKCTHANERLMVPVRKPGRPLSSCPHPSSRTCSCAAVTAAIPRKQKCRCGTSQPPAPPNPPSASAAEPSPPSPSKASSAFRVQKQPSKAAPSRTQSVDLAGLGRMDASQLNILSACNGAHVPPLGDMSLYGMGLTPVESPFGPEPAMYPAFPYPLQSPVMAPSSPEPSSNGHAKPSADTGRPTPTRGGCCGGGGVNGAQAAPLAPRQVCSPSPAANGPSEAKVKASCCSDSQGQRRNDSLPAHPNDVVMPPFQPPLAMPNTMYPYFPQPKIFNYPPQFGSFLQPLQPEQWKQFMATMAFAQPVAPSAFGMVGPEPYRTTANVPGKTWTSHQCSCGDSCQCVGCAAHPYNEATQNYVRSAWSTVMEDVHKTRLEVNIDGQANKGHEQQPSHARNGATTPVKNHAEGTVSPPAPQTPSDGTSGVGEEQTLSANDFFFVSYPFDSCAGDTASCPCGDDCQCIGCVIHSNPGPEEAPGG